MLPLQIELSSLEVPVQVRALIDLPDNLLVIDQVPDMLLVDAEANLWRWQATLPEYSSALALLYAQLLDDSDATVDLSVSVDIDGVQVEIGQEQLMLISEGSRDYLDEGLQALQALVMNYPDENDFGRALGHAQDAQDQRLIGNSSAAVDDLMSAITDLTDSEVADAQDARWLLDIAMLDLLPTLAL